MSYVTKDEFEQKVTQFKNIVSANQPEIDQNSYKMILGFLGYNWQHIQSVEDLIFIASIYLSNKKIVQNPNNTVTINEFSEELSRYCKEQLPGDLSYMNQYLSECSVNIKLDTANTNANTNATTDNDKEYEYINDVGKEDYKYEPKVDDDYLESLGC